jgi:hypothetical protein
LIKEKGNEDPKFSNLEPGKMAITWAKIGLVVGNGR